MTGGLFIPIFQKGYVMKFIEYRGELLSGYVPDLPIHLVGRGEMLRSF